MCVLLITPDKWEGWIPVNRFNNSICVAFVILANASKSIRSRCVIEVFGSISVLSIGD